MQKIFNSIFENELRLILIISVFNEPQNADMLYAADFLSVYGKVFNLSDNDLNGDNQYKFSEFVSRRSLVYKVLREMALYGLVTPIPTKAGIVYQITETGKNLSESLSSEYAVQYRETAKKVVNAIIGKSEIEIISQINAVSAKSLKESL